MVLTIFYSWQSDLPNRSNRSFILKGLEAAAASLRAENELAVEPVIDRDTQGLPGAPDIPAAILAKIDACGIFVADVSIVSGKEQIRPAPNPNVLLELGYALKTLGPERIVLVMNTIFGGPELLPFDLKLKRVLTYSADPGPGDLASGRRTLEASLKNALRSALKAPSLLSSIAEVFQTPLARATSAVEARDEAAPSLIAGAFDWLVEELHKAAPDFKIPGDRDERLVEALAAEVPLAAEFARFVFGVGARWTPDVALAVHENFGQVVSLYKPQVLEAGYYESDFDFFKFAGHELFVTFTASLLRAKRWAELRTVLNEAIFIKNASYGQPKVVLFTEISQHLSLLEYRKQRLKLRRVSLHADLLQQRHTQGDLAVSLSFHDFMEADFFLYLKSALADADNEASRPWRAWSSLFLQKTPNFISEAQKRSVAEALCGVFNVPISELRERLLDVAAKLRLLFRDTLWDCPIDERDAEKIGTM